MIKFFEDITMQMIESEHQDMANRMVLLGVDYHSKTNRGYYKQAVGIINKRFALWREWQRLVDDNV